MDSQKAERLDGLNFARSSGFSDSEYEEALKIVDLPRDKNELLITLFKVRETIDKNSTSITTTTSTSTSASSSCYSSVASLPTSSNQSLESFQQQTNRQALKKTIYIDGANVARSHGKNGAFSWPGIKICVDWFLARQHPVKVFVPIERCQQCPDADILDFLKEADILVEIPVGYNDDLCVIEAARQKKAVIVSNDQFREEKRLNAIQRLDRLPFVFVNDLFLPADPLGRPGLVLEEFLQEPPEHGIYNGCFSSKTRNQQKYQRYGSLKNHNSPFSPSAHHRLSLQATTSLPLEQSKIVSNDITNLSTGANVQQYNNYQLSNHRQDNHHFHRHQLEKSISAVYSGASSGGINANNSKERDLQNLSRHKKQALCRTRSHNI